MITMRISVILFLLLAICVLSSCFPKYVSSLRLYDKNNGNTIYLVLSESGPKSNDGLIYSSESNSEREIFEGEYYIYGRGRSTYQQDKFLSDIPGLAEEYGFGKNSNAKPVGTAILVGTEGTVIDIVFYRVDPNKQTGDGIARDNKGNVYRVYLSLKRYDELTGN